MKDKNPIKKFLDLPPIGAGGPIDLAGIVSQDNMILIYGSGLEMREFYKKNQTMLRAENFTLRKFLIASGTAQNINAALPIDSKKTTLSALKALAIARHDSKKVLFAIFVLRLLNPFIFRIYPIMFKKQFCLLAKDNDKSIFSFFADNLNASREKLSFSVYGSSGKFILPIFDGETGKTLSYAKIYDKETRERGENEAAALRFLEKFQFETAEPPKLMASKIWNGYFINFISTKEGLKVLNGETDDYLKWIDELAKKTGKKNKFENSRFAEEMAREIKSVKNELGNNYFELVKSFYNNSLGNLLKGEFVFSFINGEFDYHEFLHHKNKNLVIDWENARNDFPPIFDVFNLILSDNLRLFKKNSYSEMHLKNLNFSFFGGNKKWNNMVDYFLRRWAMSRSEAYSFFIFFLIDKIYNFTFSGSNRDREIILKFLDEIRKNPLKYEQAWIKSAAL